MVNYPLRKFSPTKEWLLPMLVHEALVAFVAKTARGVYGKYGAVHHVQNIAHHHVRLSGCASVLKTTWLNSKVRGGAKSR